MLKTSDKGVVVGAGPSAAKAGRGLCLIGTAKAVPFHKTRRRRSKSPEIVSSLRDLDLFVDSPRTYVLG